MTLQNRRMCLLAALVGSLLCSAISVNAADTPSRKTWAALADLPDWSGTWAMTVKDHEDATLELKPDDGGLVPFTPKYLELRRTLKARAGEEPLAQCLPAGIPGVMLHRIGFEWLFTPGRVTMITENGEVRRIRTDGSPHRSLEEMDGSYEGDSIGHWQGKTLVIDTIGFPNGALQKNGDLRPTINTRYVERVYSIDKDHIRIDSTLSDPEIFTKPYSASRVFERVDYPLPEPQCAQTSRSIGGPNNEVLNLKVPD